MENRIEYFPANHLPIFIFAVKSTWYAEGISKQGR